MAKIARGERNNNPGNIRHGSKWQGLSIEQTDKDFCQFISPEYGIRAIYKLLQTYQKKYGLNTIKTIINRYAPPNENNTAGYIIRASKEIGIEEDNPINTQLKNVAIPLAVVIVNIELGYQPYSEKVFEDAWLLL
ncbi:structural protein [Proteus sp. DFP240708]|uniref:structural protein n=2 Tax=Morganellaceae TaxID=1903414 RepID=UPI0018E4494E|nr:MULTISPECIES: structural protein [Proteus]MBI6215999.1 structural protein [Proteus vulgaris]MBI6337813.1 structural protein [Proteus sp. PR00224]MBI6405288.1 structural protein [Proteus sp. PR00208]MBI6542765.1 structural protein [Proteus vulgaris]